LLHCTSGPSATSVGHDANRTVAGTTKRFRTCERPISASSVKTVRGLLPLLERAESRLITMIAVLCCAINAPLCRRRECRPWSARLFHSPSFGPNSASCVVQIIATIPTGFCLNPRPRKRMCSQISQPYRLPLVLRDNPELGIVGWLTLIQSIRCVRLLLWDEGQQRLVSFHEVRQRCALV
jgi:hypothetical protein